MNTRPDEITPLLYSPLYLLIVEREGRVEPLVSLSLSLSRLSLSLASYDTGVLYDTGASLRYGIPLNRKDECTWVLACVKGMCDR